MKKYYLLLLCLCGCAMAQPDGLPPVIDNSSYPEAAPPPMNTTVAPAPNVMYELMGRLDKLQAEVQQLTGKVEEQENQLAELKKQQSTQYADLDERLRAIENKGATSQATTETPPAPATTPTEETPVTEPPKPPVVMETPVDTPVQPAPKPEVQASGDEKQTYQQAYAALRSGNTEQSIEQFKAYLSQYPTGGYADVAYYWLGEAYRVKLDADSARQAFNTVLEKYPNSTKIAEAILKLGYIEAEQKNIEKAREYLTRVTTEFPNTPAAHSAEKKLTQLKN